MDYITRSMAKLYIVVIAINCYLYLQFGYLFMSKIIFTYDVINF